MKVLFVSSGNSGKISPIVSAQGKSLEEIGISVSYFLIQGKGIFGYLKNIPKLRKHLKKNHYDVIHAHYSYSGFVATIVRPKIPIVVSLMGSDLMKSTSIIRKLIYILTNHIWDTTIVKSEEMATILGNCSVKIVPNGVNFSIFKPLEKRECQDSLHWDSKKAHILFAANPERGVKNFKLFRKAINLVGKKVKNLEFHVLQNVPNEKVPLYMNAAEVVCLSSKWEGSPNVIKEAMACNRPIVCTDVGDVKWLFDENKLEGHFISDFDAKSFGNRLLEAMNFSEKIGETKGRNRIKSLNLDSSSISKKLSQLYDELLYQAN